MEWGAPQDGVGALWMERGLSRMEWGLSRMERGLPRMEWELSGWSGSSPG